MAAQIRISPSNSSRLIAFRPGRVIPLVIGCVGILLCSSCGWQAKLVSRAPDDKSRVEIQQKLPVNMWGLRVTLTSGTETTVLAEQRGDSLLQFAEVYWEQDGSAVAVYTYGIQRLRLAYSLKQHRFLSFEQFESKIASKIREDYGIGPEKGDRDVFIWADTEGVDAFRKRHPEL